tara:strand:+ start:56424 stop:57179 length:756 start_codon:yes stop_codon:yes gene_type:complete
MTDFFSKPRLGVNIDHVATLRQARGENYPSIVDAAVSVLQNGADQITIHLREDRRHIQDTDVEAVSLVTKKYGRLLNLEMGCAEEIIDIAIATNPDWVCLVPEKREEKTTEGGLDLLGNDNFLKIQSAIQKMKSSNENLKISLFVEAQMEVLERCVQLNADAVEIHTGEYAKKFLEGEDIEQDLESFKKAKQFCLDKGMNCHAGHGLTDESVLPLLKEKLFEEYNIGHWIICQAVFEGLGNVTKKLRESFN